MLGSVPWQCHQGRGYRSQASAWLSGKSALQNDGNGDQNHRQTELGGAPGTGHHLPVYCLVSHSSHKDLSKYASPLSTDISTGISRGTRNSRLASPLAGSLLLGLLGQAFQVRKLPYSRTMIWESNNPFIGVRYQIILHIR